MVIGISLALEDDVARFSHVIFIDESGNGAKTRDINRYWISAAVALSIDEIGFVDEQIGSILKTNFRQNIKEIKGADIPHGLNPGRSTTDVAKSIADLIKLSNALCWIVGSHQGVNSPPDLASKNPIVKEITRQLLLERINDFLHTSSPGNSSFIIIWDISDQQELQDFSRSVAAFNDLHRRVPRSNKMVPAVLGGISHDWSGLQIADVIANYALHSICIDDGMPGGRANKADDFNVYLKPRLERDARNRLVGWKRW